MKRSQKAILLALGALTACLVTALAGMIFTDVWDFWQKPLAPPLSLPTLATASPSWSTPVPSQTPAPGLANLPAFSMPPEPTSGQAGHPSVPVVETLIPTFSVETPSATLCGGPQTMTILAIGTDSRSDGYLYGLADIIRIVRVDFVQPGISVLEIPRDLWVEIPDIADNLNGQGHERLNQAYLYGNRGFGYTDDPAQGPGLLARTLHLNFGVHVDHYLAINMRTFVRVVNEVGGIDVYLPHAVDGRAAGQSKRDDLLFESGWHHLNGDQALMLGRIRLEGVFARAEAQNYVLCGLRDKLTSPKVIPQIPDLIDAFLDNVQTDLSPEQISQLACLGPLIPRQNITFYAFPQQYFTGTRIYDPVFKGRVFVWDVDYNILRTYINAFQNGMWPLEATNTSPVPASNASSLQCP